MILIIGIRTRIFFQSQTIHHSPSHQVHLVQIVWLLQILPTSSWIAMTTRTNMDILGSRCCLNLQLNHTNGIYIIISNIRPITTPKIECYDPSLNFLIVCGMFPINLHDMLTITIITKLPSKLTCVEYCQAVHTDNELQCIHDD